jgi:hypothetical protein
MRKIGLLTMALVLALGSLGLAYAAWTDEIAIAGTVTTGDVDLNVVDYSGTWIYKDLDTDRIVNIHGWMSDPPAGPTNGLLVASAGAGPMLDADQEPIDDAVSVWFTDIFPCQDLMADILLHYDGSVPAKLFAEVTDVSGDQLLIDNLEVEFIAFKLLPGFEPGMDAHQYLGEQVDIGVQMEECEYILVDMWVHLPQNNDLMNLSGKFAARIVAVQWNEFEEWMNPPTAG